MKKFEKIALTIIVLMIIFLPIILFDNIDILVFFLTEGVMTIFHYVLIIVPLSLKANTDDPKKIRKRYLFIRVFFILFLYALLGQIVVDVDAYVLVYGTFFSFISTFFSKNSKRPFTNINSSVESTTLTQPTPTQVECPNCHSSQDSNNRFCTNCGLEIPNSIPNKKIVRPVDFDPLYCNTEDVMLEKFLEKELADANFEKPTLLIPQVVKKRKNIFSILLSILIAVYISLFFFHFPIYTYIIGLIIIYIVIKKTQRYDFMTYLKKEIKSRPQEKISNIVMNVKNSLVQDNQRMFRIAIVIIAIIAPLVFFANPRIMYEKVENGYAVRFYTFGLTNFKTAEIPEKHKGKPVVSLRGNTFSNMFFLEEVTLPDTITEIRGQAFKNDIKLEKVNIPVNLEYLGGGAFYNCTSITEIELPDTLTFLGGESFYNASSLEKIKLSEKIPEIRGNTFENCSSLKSITIPDSVTRIGGHAFYGNSSLSEVILSENSQLTEIGSSAFRLCSKLSSITIPENTSINERAFKESPTRIKRFGDIDYKSLVDKKEYEHYSFMYLQNVGDIQKVNQNISSAIIYNTELTLADVTLVNGYYEYTLKYTDELGEIEFTLSINAPYKKINDNLVISIGSEYALTSYNGGFSVSVYYN